MISSCFWFLLGSCPSACSRRSLQGEAGAHWVCPMKEHSLHPAHMQPWNPCLFTSIYFYFIYGLQHSYPSSRTSLCALLLNIAFWNRCGDKHPPGPESVYSDIRNKQTNSRISTTGGDAQVAIVWLSHTGQAYLAPTMTLNPEALHF